MRLSSLVFVLLLTHGAFAATELEDLTLFLLQTVPGDLGARRVISWPAAGGEETVVLKETDTGDSSINDIALDESGRMYYVAEKGSSETRIKRLTLQSGTVETIVISPNDINSIYLDLGRDRVWWAEPSAIKWADINDAVQENTLEFSSCAPSSIHTVWVDPLADRIVFSTRNGATGNPAFVANLDGSNCRSIKDDNPDDIAALFFDADPDLGRMYYGGTGIALDRDDSDLWYLDYRANDATRQALWTAEKRWMLAFGSAAVHDGYVYVTGEIRGPDPEDIDPRSQVFRVPTGGPAVNESLTEESDERFHTRTTRLLVVESKFVEGNRFNAVYYVLAGGAALVGVVLLGLLVGGRKSVTTHPLGGYDDRYASVPERGAKTGKGYGTLSPSLDRSMGIEGPKSQDERLASLETRLDELPDGPAAYGIGGVPALPPGAAAAAAGKNRRSDGGSKGSRGSQRNKKRNSGSQRKKRGSAGDGGSKGSRRSTGSRRKKKAPSADAYSSIDVPNST